MADTEDRGTSPKEKLYQGNPEDLIEIGKKKRNPRTPFKIIPAATEYTTGDDGTLSIREIGAGISRSVEHLKGINRNTVVPCDWESKYSAGPASSDPYLHSGGPAKHFVRYKDEPADHTVALCPKHFNHVVNRIGEQRQGLEEPIWHQEIKPHTAARFKLMRAIQNQEHIGAFQVALMEGWRKSANAKNMTREEVDIGKARHRPAAKNVGNVTISSTTPLLSEEEAEQIRVDKSGEMYESKNVYDPNTKSWKTSKVRKYDFPPRKPPEVRMGKVEPENWNPTFTTEELETNPEARRIREERNAENIPPQGELGIGVARVVANFYTPQYRGKPGEAGMSTVAKAFYRKSAEHEEQDQTKLTPLELEAQANKQRYIEAIRTNPSLRMAEFFKGQQKALEAEKNKPKEIE